MFKIISARWITATAAAALVGSLAVCLTPVAPEARAETQAQATISQPAHAKADRLPLLVTGRACSSTSWPNYDRGCQFDLRRSADDVRTVRIVNLEKPVSLVVAAGK